MGGFVSQRGLAPELASILELAVEEARHARHRAVDVAHVMWALLSADTVRGVLELSGVRSSKLDERLDVYLSRLGRRSRDHGDPPASDEALDLLRSVDDRAAYGHRGPIDAIELLGEMCSLRDPTAVWLLAADEVEPVDVLVAICHDLSPDAMRRAIASPLPRGATGVWAALFHDDSYTTQDFVVDVLRTVFDLLLGRATALMQEVHERGCGRLEAFRAEDAATRIGRALLRARNEGMPLLISAEQVNSTYR